MLTAGTDTTSTFLEWSVAYLMKYPAVQEKVFTEIKNTIGLNRGATYSDRGQTPYCEAVMEEIMRTCGENYLNVPHSVTKDVHALGYFFPKDTQVFIFHGAIQKNGDVFENPDEFRPERYLDEEGKFHPHPHMNFFGIGKRRCLGEVLAKAEVYLFFMTIFTHFKFRAPVGEEVDLEPVPGIVFNPKPYNTIVTLRN